MWIVDNNDIMKNGPNFLWRQLYRCFELKTAVIWSQRSHSIILIHNQNPKFLLFCEYSLVAPPTYDNIPLICL